MAAENEFPTDEILEHFLLGLLPEEQAQHVDMLYLSDQTLFDRIEAIERKLIKRYVNNELKPEIADMLNEVYRENPKRSETFWRIVGEINQESAPPPPQK